MAQLLHAVQESGYRPDYPSLVIRDKGIDPAESIWGEDEWYESVRSEQAASERGIGTLAVAGTGWLQAWATGSPGHDVLLESYDGVPPDDHEAWADVVETPFRSGSGTAGPDQLINGGDFVTLRLGEPGSYRVRVARNPLGPPNLYRFRLQFWPAPEQPPRWLVRSGPALPATGPRPGLHELSALACDVVQIVCWAPQESWRASLAGLAGHLLAGVDDVRQALRHATGRTPPLLAVTSDDGEPVDDWEHVPADLPLRLTLWSEPDDPAEEFNPDAYEVLRLPPGTPGPVASAYAAQIAEFFASSEEDLLRGPHGEGGPGTGLPPGAGPTIPPGMGGPPAG